MKKFTLVLDGKNQRELFSKEFGAQLEMVCVATARANSAKLALLFEHLEDGTQKPVYRRTVVGELILG